MFEPGDPVNSFVCSACGVSTDLAESGDPQTEVPCGGCGESLGLYAVLNQRRQDRLWVITGGRPEQFRKDD